MGRREGRERDATPQAHRRVQGVFTPFGVGVPIPQTPNTHGALLPRHGQVLKAQMCQPCRRRGQVRLLEEVPSG